MNAVLQMKSAVSIRRRRLARAAGVCLSGLLLLGAAGLSATGCGKDPAGPPQAPADTLVEPDHVVVQHLLVGFAGSVPGKEIDRSRGAARGLAHALLEQARAGADFDALVRDQTDDYWPGIYGMSNLGVPPNTGADPKEYPRSMMVPAFGNVGFRLRVGEYGLAEYDPHDSPYGWHLIKRLR